MDTFLPSEIGRLIYGYLFQQCGESLADEFLNSCDSMRECRLLKQKYAKNFHHKVQDLSLEDILNQYSVLCSLIFKQATGEEPVHRNVLGLLKKVLSSRLLGRSSSSADHSRHAKPTGNRAGSSVGDKIEAAKAGIPISQSVPRAIPASDEVNSSVGNRTRASISQLEQSENLADKDNVAFSPDINAARDDHMDVDDNASGSGDSLEEDSASNVAEESASVVTSTECPQKTISPSAESRICAILCNSASQEERARQLIGAGSLPFPAEYCTPRKEQGFSVPPVVTPPCASLTKTPISAASMVVNTPLKVMKSIENVAKNLPLAAESGISTPKPGEHMSKKPADEVAVKNKVLQRGTKRTPSKNITKSSSITTTSSSIAEFTSSAISSPADKVNDQLVTTVPDAGAVEESSSTVPVNLSGTPVPTFSSVYQEPRVSATASLVTNVQEAPVMTPACAIIPEESTESVFGELSFESECSLPSKLDRSSSSVKSDCEAVGKVQQLPHEDSPLKADDFSVDSSLVASSEVVGAPVQIPTTRNAETTSQSPTKSVADAVVLPDSDETECTGSRRKGTPWDLYLRSFVGTDLPMDAHITKRKPKDPRTRKQKEVAKKRKHNDDPDDPLAITKRLKSDVAAVQVSVAVPRQLPLVTRSVDADRTAGLVPSPLRQCRAAKDVAESTRGLEKKGDKNGRGRGGQEGKLTPETSSRVRVAQESKRTPEATSTTRSSMNDILDFDGPAADKRKADGIEKATVVEKKQAAAAKKANQKEAREATKTRSRAKPVALEEKEMNSNGAARGRKKSERIEEQVAAKKKSKDVDPKSVAFKEPSHPQIKEKPLSSPRKTNTNSRKAAQNKTSNDVDKKAGEVMAELKQPVVVVKTTIDDSGVHDDDELDFDMVLEISPEFELYCRSPRCGDS